MPSSNLSLNLRTLRLGSEQRASQSASAPSQTPPISHDPYDGFSESGDAVPTVQLEVTQQGHLAARAPVPSPPFRLLPPSQNPSRATSPVPDVSRETSPRPYLDPESASYGPTAQAHRARYGVSDHEEDRRLQRELRGRPLHESVYGRHIVGLLTMQWVVAPSGLAATVFPLGTEERYVEDCAHYINLLVCGTEAFPSGAAGVLGLYSIAQLNRLLIKSGLSPIAPLPAPENWAPLAARVPPDFLLEGFAIRGSAPAYTGDDL